MPHQDQYREIPLGRVVTVADFEGGGADLTDPFAAKTDEVGRFTLVDHQPKILDRSLPVGAGR